MSCRFVPGDYVRPIDPNPGLPRNSVWVISHYHNKDIGTVALLAIDDFYPGYYHPKYVQGRQFADSHFEKVILVGRQWRKAAVGEPAETVVDPSSLADSCQNVQEEEDPLEYADKLVERAVATLDAAKENARKAREEARAVAKSEAKRKAAVEAAKKAREERHATGNRLASAHDLALATVALIKEIIRLHNGGAEQTAASDIAEHADQLQPLAKSYGYKIAKPSMIALVVKL